MLMLRGKLNLWLVQRFLYDGLSGICISHIISHGSPNEWGFSPTNYGNNSSVTNIGVTNLWHTTNGHIMHFRIRSCLFVHLLFEWRTFFYFMVLNLCTSPVSLWCGHTLVTPILVTDDLLQLAVHELWWIWDASSSMTITSRPYPFHAHQLLVDHPNNLAVRF